MRGDGHYNIPSQVRHGLPVETRKEAGEIPLGEINSVCVLRSPFLFGDSW